MKAIVFIDSEVSPESNRILDRGSVGDNGATFHANPLTGLSDFIQGVEFICGHNIIRHDLTYLGEAIASAQIKKENAIDTLFLSPLLFPSRPYHALLKDDKLQTEDSNNPLNDAIKAKQLLDDEVAAF